LAVSQARVSDLHLTAAAAGDSCAWDAIVDRHAQRVWDMARGFDLDATAAAAVCHLVWRRLSDRLDEMRTDAEVVSWLGAAVDREARAMLHVKGSERDAGQGRTETHTPSGVAPSDGAGRSARLPPRVHGSATPTAQVMPTPAGCPRGGGHAAVRATPYEATL